MCIHVYNTHFLLPPYVFCPFARVILRAQGKTRAFSQTAYTKRKTEPPTPSFCFFIHIYERKECKRTFLNPDLSFFPPPTVNCTITRRFFNYWWEVPAKHDLHGMREGLFFRKKKKDKEENERIALKDNADEEKGKGSRYSSRCWHLTTENKRNRERLFFRKTLCPYELAGSL